MVAFAAKRPSGFPAGVNDRGDRSVWFPMPYLDPTRHHVYFDDFNKYAAGDWTVTETQGAATQATANGDGGWLQLVNSAANNDVNSIQSLNSSFSFADGKQFAIKCRLKLDDATLAAAAFGAYVADTSPIASAPSDAIYFLKAAAAATIVFAVGVGSAYTTSSALLTMSDDTFYTFGAFCNGKAFVKPSDGLTYYSFLVYGGTDNDPAFITRLDVLNTGVPLSTTIMCPSISLQNGSGVVRTLTSDYLLVSKER